MGVFKCKPLHLAANTNICEYCGTRNDVDLQNTQFHNVTQDSEKPCPCCDSPLQTIDLEIGRQFYDEYR